jgi:alpha/beta superfamily hydrolase
MTIMADRMRRAADWLRCNDGEEGEAEDCTAVADWLEDEATRRDEEALARKIARGAAVSVPAARRAIKRAAR